MGLFDKLFKKEAELSLPAVEVSDEAIVAVADGEMIDVTTVPDPVFAEKMMGDSTAFRFDGEKVVLCAPANGTLSVLFPTGHAFGVTRSDGVELLVHCGVNTVEAGGDGFRLLNKKQGDTVKAGDPIVEANLKKLSAKYDMSTMLIITNPNGKEFHFLDPQPVTRGQSVITK
ncbi:MAG: PTS glucose transporter subunit IIA [Solobacterium sp.]|nr:PTS glucose transporter subunit IIA [Solobacterium sp.]